MGFKARQKYVRLFAKPKRAAKWWPRDDDDRPAWVLVFETTRGIVWTIHVDRTERSVRVPEKNVKALKEDFEDIYEREFNWRTE